MCCSPTTESKDLTSIAQHFLRILVLNPNLRSSSNLEIGVFGIKPRPVTLQTPPSAPESSPVAPALEQASLFLPLCLADIKLLGAGAACPHLGGQFWQDLEHLEGTFSQQ